MPAIPDTRLLCIALTVLLLTMHGGAVVAADQDPAAVIEALGLIEAPAPVRERVGWRPPERIVVRADEARLAWLRAAVPDVTLVQAVTSEAAVAALPGADAVIGFCSESVVEAGIDLRWIQLPYAGAERCVAVAGVRERDILVTNAQRVYGPEIAEHVLAMLLSFSRGLYLYQTRDSWERGLVAEERLWELTGKTMLVVGLGGIGTEVARRAHALGMEIIATRGSRRYGPAFVSYVGLADELLELTPRAHVVVNAAPLTPATTGLFDAAFFAAMRPDAYFINVGRGRSVVTGDLLAALDAGEIAGAGLDVTEPEPLPDGHPLWSRPDVIITPHVAAGSDRRVERLWVVLRENLRRYTAGEPMLSVVDTARGY